MTLGHTHHSVDLQTMTTLFFKKGRLAAFIAIRGTKYKWTGNCPRYKKKLKEKEEEQEKLWLTGFAMAPKLA
jgi:hypothetical protein